MAFEVEIEIDSELMLTEYVAVDRDRLVELLNSPDIFATTLRIPSPYTNSDAECWIEFANQHHGHHETRTNWAIRSSDNGLVGGIGFLTDENVSHRTEFGYWVGPPFWNQGIATRAVSAVCKLGFTQFELVKLTALVFDGNEASDRVLLKNGFVEEGFFRNHFLKNGRLIHAKCFGKCVD